MADGANGAGQNGGSTYGVVRAPRMRSMRKPSPTRETHQRYLQAMCEEIPEAVWRNICRRAADDAMNGCRYAREWISKYLVPPKQVVELRGDITLRDDRAVVAHILEHEPDAVDNVLRLLEHRAAGVGPS